MVAPDLPRVGDQRRLGVVFDNLLSNALKYTPSGGTITVNGASAAASTVLDSVDAVAIRVTDTGPIIAAAFRTRIFDKLFCLEHQQFDDRQHPRGAGIGSYMCRQIVELHGGQISCAAGADERGACITVKLPVSSPTDAGGRTRNRHRSRKW